MIEGLRREGGRITAQRIAICEWLLHAEVHPTAAEVYEALLPQFPTMSLATVYNTLSTLESLDLLHPLGRSTDGSQRYDVSLSPHVNLLCLRCGSVIDVHDVDLSALEAAAAALGFNVEHSNIVIHGLCQACQTQERERQA